MRVRSSSSRRQLPIYRSMIEFILGACTAEWMTLSPADWKTASNAALKLASRSCSTNLARMPTSSRSIRRFRACCVNPGLHRVLCGSENPDPAATVLDDGQEVHLGAIEQVGGEEVQRQDRLCLSRRNSAQPGPSRRGAGPILASLRICQTVDGATVTPSTASSPWTRR
jgi:hypothetical protein